MSIPFMSDVDLKSLNDRTFYVKTQADFDYMMNLMNMGGNINIRHFIIYPLASGAAYAPIPNSWVIEVNSDCLVEGIGNPTIENLSCVALDNAFTSIVEFKGLHFRFNRAWIDSSAHGGAFYNISRLENCTVTFAATSENPYVNETLFLQCKNISNLTINFNVNKDYSSTYLFCECRNLSHITLLNLPYSSTRLKSVNYYVYCIGVDSHTCTNAIHYVNDLSFAGIYYNVKVDYGTKTVEAIAYRSRTVTGTLPVNMWISINAMKTHSTWTPHIPSTLKLPEDYRVVGTYVLTGPGASHDCGMLKGNFGGEWIHAYTSDLDIPEGSGSIFSFTLHFE